jgi:hypothetical protein
MHPPSLVAKESMSADELQELHEHAQHGAHNPEMAPVSLTMAILAVLVAIVTLLGHRMHTEEVVMQTRANDQWAYYQGKDTRLHTDQKLLGMAGFLPSSDSGKAASWLESTKGEAEKYDNQKDEIQSEARKLEAEATIARRRADRFDLGEVFLEVALVITSITLLSGRKVFWWLGMASGAIGVLVAASHMLIQ